MSTERETIFRIDRDYHARMAHARSMYYMAVQAAEAELETALARARDTWEAELAEARRTAHSAAKEAS